MSKTYRRKQTGSSNGVYSAPTKVISKRDWNGKEYFVYLNEFFDHYPSNQEIRKASSRYHSDSGTHSFKEPGPSWFRNMTDTRPTRRQNKRELQKFLKNPDYEPMCYGSGKLNYWT